MHYPACVLSDRRHEQRELELQAEDAESLLVVFLGELLHFIEQDNLAFDEFQIESGWLYTARLS